MKLGQRAALVLLLTAGMLSACVEPSYSEGSSSDAGLADDTSAASASSPNGTSGPNEGIDPAPGNSTGPEVPGPEVPGPAEDEDGGVLFGGTSAPSISVGADPMPDDTTEPGEQNDPPIGPCEAATASGNSPAIDDFEDGDMHTLVEEGRDGDWYLYNSDDDSDSHLFEIEVVNDSPAGGEFALHTAGSGFQWAGIGVGLLWNDGNNDCIYDAASYEGLTFWGRGSGSVRFTVAMPETIPIESGGSCDELEMSCWNHPGVDVTFTDSWQQYVVPFTNMEQSSGSLRADPTRIRTIQFETGTEAVFDFWIDGFSFYSASHPPPAGVPIEPEPDPEPEPTDPEPPEPDADGGAPSRDLDASIPIEQTEQDAATESPPEGGTP